MKAITFAAPIPTYLLTLAAGKLSPGLRVGPRACTRFTELPDPALPGDRWVGVRTRLGGICGSDLGIVELAASPSTSPFSSFPFVIGQRATTPAINTPRAGRSDSGSDRAGGLLSGIPATVRADRCPHHRGYAVACSDAASRWCPRAASAWR